MNLILVSLAVLGGTGIIAAVVLYIVAKKFYTYEDPRIAEVESMLPGANCGACGFSGCHDFAVNCVKAKSLDGLSCPGAGEEGMKRIADFLGLSPVASEPKLAVLRCNGSCENRPSIAEYDGAQSCALLTTLAVGTGACGFGCLGCGDCIVACPWDAMVMDEETGLPKVLSDKCIGCGKCVAACPRHLFELRSRGIDNKRVWVACANKEKGAIAMKACKVACIGCAKCKKACEHDAITVADFLSYIDYNKCVACGNCVEVCPTHAISDTLTHEA